MNYISIKHLKALGACKEQTQKFKEIFGESVKFESLEEAQDLALKYAQEFDFGWIGGEVFGEAYEEAEANLWKAYREAKAPLWKAYQEAKATLLKAYEEAEASLRKVFLEGHAKIFARMWWELKELLKKEEHK